MKTKDSGSRRQWSTGAVRDAGEKPSWANQSLADWNAIRDRGTPRLLVDRSHPVGPLYEGYSPHPVYFPNIALIHPLALLQLQWLLERGAMKYGDHNWQQGIPPHVYYDSLMRHLLAAANGGTDEAHLAAVMYNAMGWLVTEAAIYNGDLPDSLLQPGFGILGNQ